MKNWGYKVSIEDLLKTKPTGWLSLEYLPSQFEKYKSNKEQLDNSC